jgi:hypothetical protein
VVRRPRPAAEQVEDAVGALPVEVARRLVAQQEGRIGDDRPRDRDALLLPARQLPRKWTPVRETDHVEGRLHVLAPLAARERGQQQRQLDVAIGREDRDQVVGLEHEADVPGAPFGQAPAREPRDLVPRDGDRSGRRDVEPARAG